MAPMVAPTKRAPNVSPSEGMTGEGCDDIAGYKEGVEEALGRQLYMGRPNQNSNMTSAKSSTWRRQYVMLVLDV